MSRPKLLVVDLEAVMTELDAVRATWIDAAVRRLRATWVDDEVARTYDLTAMEAQAATEWADAYPALELLRDEVRP